MINQSITKLKPTSSGQRFTSLLKRNHLLKIKRLKNKCVPNKMVSGRNHSGQITLYHRGSGLKHLYRNLDLNHKNSDGLVEGYEYDPNRKAHINRLFNPDNHNHNYVLGVKDLSCGKILRSFQNAKLKNGHSLSLNFIPNGYVVHNVSPSENKGGVYLRSAGSFGQLVQKTHKAAVIKLRSGEHKKFSLSGTASIGSVCCEDHKLTNLGKAGRKRWLGFRPTVRGVAINPVDHPHGGGEGKTSGGRPSVTPWGKPTKGQPSVLKKTKLKL
jgi:large subunit ribosomal protein L2